MKTPKHPAAIAQTDHAVPGIDVDSCLEFLEHTDFLVLLLLAVVAHNFSLQMFSKTAWRPFAKFLVLPFALITLIQLWNRYPITDDLGVATQVLSRWGLGCWLAYSVAALPAIFAMQLACRYAQREWARLQEFSKGLQDWHSSRTKSAVPPMANPIPSPPREVNVFRNSEQARLDYEFECRIITDANLEGEEREAALDQAKQKYLLRLNRVLE